MSYNAENTTLKDVLQAVESQYGFRFAYSESDLPTTPFSFSVQNLTIERLLNALLQPFIMSYDIVDNNYIILKNERKFNVVIYDAESGETIPFVSIVASSNNKTFVTNEDGQSEILIKISDSKHFNLQSIGYEEKEFQIDPINYKDTFKVLMTPKTTQLNEVVITEYLNPGVQLGKMSTAITLSPQKMDILPGLSEPDILLSAQMLPGISSVDESASGISIRGSGPDQTMYFWNDIPVYTPAHYFGNISSFIPSAIGDTKVYKSEIPAQYGGSTAGLMLIETRKATNPIAEVNVNLTHADFYAQSNLSKKLGNLMLAGRRSYNDLFLTPTFNAMTSKIFDGSTTSDLQQGANENTFDYSTKLTFSDLNAVWSLDYGKMNTIKLSWLSSKSVMNFDSDGADGWTNTQQTNDVQNSGLGLSWQHQWSNFYNSTLKASWNNHELMYGSETSDNFNQTYLSRERENTLKSWRVRLNHQFTFNENFNIDIGHHYKWFNNTGSDYFAETSNNEFEEYQFDRNDQTYIVSNYLKAEFKPSEKWKLTGGIRQMYYKLSNENALAPQASVYFSPRKSWTFKALFGIYKQFIVAAPETEFNLSNIQEQFWVLSGTNNISAIKNQQFSTGLTYSKKGWIIDFEAYKKHVSGLDSRRTSHILQPGFLTKEDILGADILLKKRFRWLRLWLSYSYQDSKVDIPSLNIENMASFYNSNHQIQLAFTYEWHNLQVSSGYTFRSGIPYTPATDFVPSDDYFIPVFDESNSDRLPNYNRLDLSVWYAFLPDKSKHISGKLGFSLLNVTNAKNYYNRNYFIEDDDDNNFSLNQNDSRLYGITPNLSLKLTIK